MLSDLFYRESRLTVLAVLFIAVAGLAGLQALERQEDPALSRRFAEIEVRFPGATAERVEALVTEPIENELQGLHEIKTIESISRTGLSYTRVELEDQYNEPLVDEVWSRVRDRLADVAATLPAGASPPEFEDQTSTAVTIVVGFAWDGEGEPQLAVMTRLAEELATRLRVLSGTKETELYGEAQEELRVTVDPLRLAEIGLDAGAVARAIERADTKRPAGQLTQTGVQMPLEVAGELSSVDRVRRVPLRGDDRAQLLRVGDVARVEKTRVDPPRTAAMLGGKPGVAVSATMLPGSGRVDLWAERARAVVDEFAAEVPEDIEYRVLFDQSEFTVARLGTLVRNLVLGALIVVGVLLAMMGLRSALIVASILPLTFGMVLAELNAFGVPLHQISVSGLIIALGMLIDNAIVVVDEYELRRGRGLDVAASVRAVVSDLFVPLGASTLTTVLAFLPIVLAPGPAGEFVGTISVSVGLAVVSSFLLSMTLILAFAGRFDAHHRAQRSGWLHEGFSSPRLHAWFRRGIVRILERPALGIAVSLVLPILGFVGGSTLPQQFFPANDRNQFQLQIVLPVHAPIAETRASIDRARELVEAHDEVIESHWFAGEMAPRVYYNMLGSQNRPNFASAFVITDSPEATEALLPGLQRELMAAFPQAIVVALPFEQGPPFEAPIEVRVVGPDLERLRAIGDQVRGVLASTEGVTYTQAKLTGGRPKLLLHTDEDATQLVGLRLADVAEQLNAALDGAAGGQVLESTEELPIRVRVGDDARGSFARIAATRLLPASAREAQARDALAGVPLGAVGRLSLQPELAGISRRNGERDNTLQAFLVPYTLISESLSDFRRRFDEAAIALPEGYRIELGGEEEQRSEALGNLAAFALPLFVVMAGAIILTFNSFRMAGIIFAVAFSSVGLALGGVFLFGHPMGFMAIVGTMGLVGLAINDAIVVLNALRLDPRSVDAEPEPTADVVVDATRHVLATTLTTVGGFLPLIVFGGRFWPPMATAIAGGVIGASILALYMVPSLYALLRRRRVEEVEPALAA